MSLTKRSLAKRIAVSIVGGTITLIGVAMIVLPGPAIVVIPLGLSILATEFVWARRYLRRGRTMAMTWKAKIKARTKGRRAEDTVASRSAYSAPRGVRGGAPD